MQEPDGLVAIGGCLNTQRLLNAYRMGIFPWFSAREPILWWSPNPRLVLFPKQFNISRSLRKTLRKNIFQVSFDQAFSEVIDACASPRPHQNGTWITEEMNRAYNQLFTQGIAHSFEAWHEGRLVGGIYGLAIGQVFFGESMFHRKTDASKVVFAHLISHLIDWNFQLIDCQVHSNHLVSLGAIEIERRLFTDYLQNFCNHPPSDQAWLER